MANSLVRWSNLPPELWPLIGKRLDSYIDILRFRSVCRSWRSSLPLSPVLPLLLPCPFDDDVQLITDDAQLSADDDDLLSTDDENEFPTADAAQFPFADVLLIPRLICRISSDSASSASAAEGWLVKVESTKLGEMRFLRPIVKSSGEVLRKEVNLLDFRIQEVAKSYTLRYTSGDLVPEITRVVMSPDSPWIIVAVDAEGKLGFINHGDGKWTTIGCQNFHYDDVIVSKGQFYAVDRCGTVFWIDSSMKLVQFSPPSRGLGDQKHLLECGGEIYVVDRFLYRSRCCEKHIENLPSKVIGFKVHRLDQEWGKWVEVKNLGERAFVLGNEGCFSVSAPDFEGIKGSCIYFSYELNSDLGCYTHSTYVFDLKERRILKLKASANIFRATPIFLDEMQK